MNMIVLNLTDGTEVLTWLDDAGREIDPYAESLLHEPTAICNRGFDTADINGYQ